MTSCVLCLPCSAGQESITEGQPDYSAQVEPILQKYCASCHNGDAFDGELSFDSYEELLQGGSHGAAVLAGDATNSRLIRLIRGDAEPRMPPDDMEGPNEDEMAILIRWIDAGALGPAGEAPDRTRLIVPQLPAAEGAQAITAMAWSPTKDAIAVARFQSVELIRTSDGAAILELDDLPGKVNQLTFSADGEYLLAASGVTGLVGVAIGWHTSDGQEAFRVQGHRDALYAVAIDSHNRQIATAGYDKTIRIWDVESQQMIRELQGHNQPVFSLDFHPTLPVLISASADETLKVWNTDSGERLDTLSQPLAEQYVARFTPDGSQIVGAGADNRIRIWRFESREQPAINPLRHAMYAHEGPIAHVDFSADGTMMVSVAEDRTIKLWDTTGWQEQLLLPKQPAFVSAIALAPDRSSLRIGRMDGSLESFTVSNVDQRHNTKQLIPSVRVNSLEAVVKELAEAEPNGSAADAQAISIPARVKGVIDSTSNEVNRSDTLNTSTPMNSSANSDPTTQADESSDVDVFRMQATAGSSWVIEVNAQRSGSPLDSMIEVLDEQGQPIERVLLQAVRDSYFTFRGKDSSTSDDFRVHNWEEMELNEYLYSDGEVTKLWLYPRGPDSGFKVYPGKGSRHTYFGTTPLAHALQAPCYIVEPHAPGTTLIANGLPVFPVYWENDDDSKRQLGSDSRLIFVAPEDGPYLVRVSDARGFSGSDFNYELTIRPAQPNFRVSSSKISAAVSPGSGLEFTVDARRIDGFDGDIVVEVEGLPPGFHASSPIRIEAGHYEAKGMIWAEPDAPQPSDKAPEAQLVAWADIEGDRVEHRVNSFGQVKLADKPSLQVRLLPQASDEDYSLTNIDAAEAGSSGENRDTKEPAPQTDASSEPDAQEATDPQPLILTIRPGQTIAARVRIHRHGHEGLVSFGKEDSGRNLPHGVFVDNIGLNGLMIVEGQQERTFFITCADWVQPQERVFHLRAEQQGGQCSLPAVIRVLPASSND